MSRPTLLLSLFEYKAWADTQLLAEMAPLNAAAHARGAAGPMSARVSQQPAARRAASA
jgi:uncharacterized damage-inducible protein DinB